MLRNHRLTFGFRHLAVAATLIFAFGGLAQAEEEKKGPPFADGPDTPKVPPKPETRTWTVVNAPFTFNFLFKPGIPALNEVVEIEVDGLEKPATPDPKYGSTVPMIGAKLVGAWISPAGETINRFWLHPVPLSQGKYALHLTPSADGIHELRISGTLADGRAVAATVKVPVDLWPLPKELEGSGDQSGSARRRRPVRK